MMRSRLVDVTNTNTIASQGRKRSRAQAEEQDGAIKPPSALSRVNSQVNGDKAPPSPADLPKSAGFDPRRGCSHRLIRQSRLAPSPLSASSLSTRPILESFVSSDVDDVYSYDRPSANSPFVGVYSHASKHGKQQVLAIGQTNQIQLVNTSKNDESSALPIVIPHATDSVVSDLLWRRDDKQIAAACDETVAIYDVENRAPVGHFRGHTAGIKALAWNPSNDAIIASASRDGNICIWDTRLHSGALDANADPVLLIKQAHNPAARRKRNMPASTSKSVTSILYLPQSPHHLVSSGSSDGILMKWDCRSVKSVSSSYAETLEDPTVTFTQSKRTRGITSLAFGPNAATIYGLGADAIPYTYLTHSLQAIPTSEPSNQATKTGTGSISLSSRLSASPCGRWLAASGTEGSTNLYEIPRHSGVIDRDPVVVLRNQAREVTGLSWAGSDTLGTFSNDYTVRIWRCDAEMASLNRRDSDASSSPSSSTSSKWKYAERF